MASLPSRTVRTAEGKVRLFLAVDRVPKLLPIELRNSVRTADGVASMASAVEAFSYAVHTVLTDDGVAFTDQPRHWKGATAGFHVHVLDRVRRANGIEKGVPSRFAQSLGRSRRADGAKRWGRKDREVSRVGDDPAQPGEPKSHQGNADRSGLRGQPSRSQAVPRERDGQQQRVNAQKAADGP